MNPRPVFLCPKVTSSSSEGRAAALAPEGAAELLLLELLQLPRDLPQLALLVLRGGGRLFLLGDAPLLAPGSGGKIPGQCYLRA